MHSMVSIDRNGRFSYFGHRDNKVLPIQRAELAKTLDDIHAFVSEVSGC